MKYYLLNCTFPHRENNCEDITSKGVYGLTHQLMLTAREAKIFDKIQINGGVSHEKWNIDVISVEKISQEDYERFSNIIHGPCSAIIKEYIWRYLETVLTNQEDFELENNASEACYLIDIYYNSVNNEAKQYWFQMMADEQEAEILVHSFGEFRSSPEFKLYGGDNKDLEGVAYTGICEVSREEYDRLNSWLGRCEEKCCREVLKIISKCLEKENRAVDEGKRQREEWPARFGGERKLEEKVMISENEMEYDDEESRIKKKVKQY